MDQASAAFTAETSMVFRYAALDSDWAIFAHNFRTTASLTTLITIQPACSALLPSHRQLACIGLAYG